MENINSLDKVVQNWFDQQPKPRQKYVIEFTMNPDGRVKSTVRLNATIRSCLIKDHIKRSYSKNLISRTEDNLIYELRKHQIDWNEASLIDFMKIFPTQISFSKTRNVGTGTIALLKDILTSYNHFWPEK